MQPAYAATTGAGPIGAAGMVGVGGVPAAGAGGAGRGGVTNLTLLQRSAAGGAGDSGDQGISLIDMPRHDGPVTNDADREEQRRNLLNKQVRTDVVGCMTCVCCFNDVCCYLLRFASVIKIIFAGMQ